ncbi:hypothetical protein BDR03DRAFT_945763 [Suillus americanus]|nr:hypothetical protein BDR03DRAFT_945763 [Suillus americanus]
MAALCIQGLFLLDEYFHWIWTPHTEWVSPAPLRSIIYPALNIPPFRLIKTLGLDTRYPELLVSFLCILLFFIFIRRVR